MSDSELRVLEAEARYAHECASLYRARVWSRKRPASDARMRHLEHVEQWTAERLQRERDKNQR